MENGEKRSSKKKEKYQQHYRQCQEAKLDDIPMHDRKAALWCEQLEQWAVKSKVNVDILLLHRPDEP